MVGTKLTNLTNKKAFVHRAFRRASEEPDVQIKREIKKIMADNFKIYLLEGEKIQTENGFRRADLIDTLRMAFNGLVDIQNRLSKLSSENLISELEIIKMWLAAKLTDEKPNRPDGRTGPESAEEQKAEGQV